jgi:hypothetical protein
MTYLAPFVTCAPFAVAVALSWYFGRGVGLVGIALAAAVDDLLAVQPEPGTIELFEDYCLGGAILATEWLAAIKRRRWIPATVGKRLILARVGWDSFMERPVYF